MLATTGAMISFQAGAAVAKGLFPTIGPEGAAALRLGLGAILLLVIVRPWRDWPSKPPLLPLLALGVSTALAILMFYRAITLLPLGVAIPLQFLGPLTVAIIGSRRPSDLIWAGLAALGVWCLVGLGAARTPINLAGVPWALGAAVGWGVYIHFGQAATTTFGRSTGALALSVAALVAVPLGIWHAGGALANPRVWPTGLLIGVLSAALPFSLELFAMARMPARTFAVFTSLEPAFAVMSGFLLLHEQLAPGQLAGVAVVMTAAAGAAWSSSRADPGAHAIVADAPPN
ncbi:MAG TPA: EamA family transporter [Caulobacteraceae bacterium]|jgi:inner membrane transporter RhtA